MLRIYTDRRCAGHLPPPGFPERGERLSAILDHLRDRAAEVVDLADAPAEGPAEEAIDAAVEGLHDPAYVARFRRAVRRGDGLLDSADTPLSPGTWEAARAAVRAGLAAVAWTAAAEGREAFVAVRPPGHHAERATAMGFCYFCTVGLAAEELRRLGRERVAVVDFDVHHGNGTQHLFEERGDVLVVNLHQYPFYPGTGAAGERGRGAGLGATVNFPLPAGSGDDEYGEVFRHGVLPALAGFAPDALLVSAGFDAWRGDPLGGMRVSERGYGEWGRRLRKVAAERCGGRLVSFLEGGYDVASVPRLVAAYLGLDGDLGGAARPPAGEN